MRCKRHPCDVGVCATCLRERLLALVAVQSAEAGSPNESPDGCGESDIQPPPLVFPRSVSPYVSRRSAAGNEIWRLRQFYSTPQAGPINGKSENRRFSLISSIFRSRSVDLDSDPRVSGSGKVSSPSWISNLLSGRRKKKSRLFSLDEEISGIGGCRRSCRTRGRGMSPATERNGKEEGSDTTAGTVDDLSDSPTGYRKTANPENPRRRNCPPNGRGVSGYVLCLSPLVRANPKPNRLDSGFPGEVRNANRLHLSTAASHGANRSRKLSNFGRYP